MVQHVMFYSFDMKKSLNGEKKHKKNSILPKGNFCWEIKEKAWEFSLVWHCCLDFAELSTDKMIADSFRRI